MGKSQKIIIGIICILIICIITLVILIQNINNLEKQENVEEENLLEKQEEYEEPILNNNIEEELEITDDPARIPIYNELIERENKKAEYVIINQSLSKYIFEIYQDKSNYYTRIENDKYSKTVKEEQINEDLYNVLSEEYIKKNSININNVKNFVYNIQEECSYIPVEIQKKYEYDKMKSYAIYGVIINKNYELLYESYIILNIDKNNKTFSVEQLKNKEELNQISIESLIAISKKDTNNVYGDINEDDVDVAVIKNYISNCKTLSLAYPEIVYERFIDNEYKQRRFKTLEEFKKYVQQNLEIIKQINITRYDVIEDGEQLQYVCMDDNGMFYIINRNTIFNYKIILDHYTIENPYFLNKYKEADNSDKVSLQIEKLTQMINTKDYNYIYNKLNQKFRNNNFSSIEKLSTYLKSNTYEINDIEIDSIEEQDDYYVCKCTLINKQNKEENKNMNIIIKLIDYSNFELSFSF